VPERGNRTGLPEPDDSQSIPVHGAPALGSGVREDRCFAENAPLARRQPEEDLVSGRSRGGTAAAEGTGQASPAFIREMLKPLREVKPQPLTALQDDVSDLRFYGVTTNGKNGMRLQAAAGQ